MDEKAVNLRGFSLIWSFLRNLFCNSTVLDKIQNGLCNVYGFKYNS